jgi:hypothetical protein
MINDIFQLLGAALLIVAFASIGLATETAPDAHINPFDAASEALDR